MKPIAFECPHQEQSRKQAHLSRSFILIATDKSPRKPFIQRIRNFRISSQLALRSQNHELI